MHIFKVYFYIVVFFIFKEVVPILRCTLHPLNITICLWIIAIVIYYIICIHFLRHIICLLHPICRNLCY